MIIDLYNKVWLRSMDYDNNWLKWRNNISEFMVPQVIFKEDENGNVLDELDGPGIVAITSETKLSNGRVYL
jgi:hypothetical protein